MPIIAINEIPFSFKKSFTVLDVGVGTGNTTLAVITKFPLANIDALDVSKKMITVAKKRLNTQNINYLLGDIETKIFENKYDLIISTLTIHHIKNKENIFKKKFGIY